MTNNVRRFFQGLTLSSFGLGIYNTIKNSNNRELVRNFNLEQEKNGKLREEIIKLKAECNEQKITSLEGDNDVLRKSLDVVTSKSEIENDLDKLKSLNEEIKRSEDNADYSLEDFQDKLNDLISKLNKDIKDNTNKTEQLIETIKNILDSNGNNLINLGSQNIFESIQNLYSNISLIDSLAIIHISGSISILICLYSIIIMLFGDKLILHFKLEDKYPKLVKFLKFRRKLQNYSITFNFILIFVILLITIFFNLYILFHYLN